MGHVTGLALFTAAGVQHLAGIAAAMLPKRWWPHLDTRVPASSMALVSGLATFLLGAAIGIPGFLAYVTDLADRINRVALATPEQAGAGAGSILMTLGLFSFLLGTPTGWVTTYLCLTGFLRTLAALVTDGFGDPVLTAIDAAALAIWGGTRTKAQQWQRESLEGPEMPDRVMSAEQLDIQGAEFVIVASRRKAGWDKGTVLLTENGAFRVTTIEERTLGGRLRTLYGVSEHRDLEVFRRAVQYNLPPGRKS